MFFTYAHSKPDGTLFYIGKGTQKRAYAKDNRNPHWQHIFNKYGRTVDMLAGWEQEEDALLHEQFLIACFKDIGYQLANVTDGGEGVSGHKHSVQSKAKMSAFQKEFQNTERMKAVHKAHSEMAKTPERRQKHSAFVKAYMSDPKNRERSRIGALKQSQDPLFIAAQRERAFTRMADSKYRYMMAKPCVCVETGQEFKSQADAAKWADGLSQTINRAITGARLTAYGYHWKLKD
jgi:hypothetical protein